MKWPISWSDVKDHIDDIEDGIGPKFLPKGGVGYEGKDTCTLSGTSELHGPVDRGSYTGYIGVFAFSERPKFEDGTICHVYLDGAKYDCIISVDETAYILGNPILLFGGEDNGLPFCFAGEYDPEYGSGGFEYFWIPPSDDTAEHVTQEVKIVQEINTIHQIDPKFIPPMDALIFNANGKQYRIAVDETGTLTTTEVG